MPSEIPYSFFLSCSVQERERGEFCMRRLSIYTKVGLRGVWLCVALALLSACSGAPKPVVSPLQAAAPAYAYPIHNPYAATIITTPADLRADYSAVPRMEEREMVVFPERVVPEGFWYQKRLKYGVLLQNHPAPLVYVIAGTGADHRSGTMQQLAALLFAAGDHVVLLPSPTHPNFIVSASSNFTPGRPRRSAQDLYRVMRRIDTEIAATSPVTARYLTGYSLGGLDAAFTAEFDTHQKQLNFQRVLLINPPLSLYSSMNVVDRMLYRGLPEGINGVDRFIDDALSRLSALSTSGDALDFRRENMALDVYNKLQPSDDKLATTIGLSFRFAAASMVFASDVMSHAGYVFPKNQPFVTETPLQDVMGVALRTSFNDYFEDFYSARYLAENSGLTRQALIDEGSLVSLAPFLRNNPKVAMITNRDDIILAPGELDQLIALFGKNARVFPNGGHMGNLAYPAFSYHIAHFLAPEAGR